ncbi:MAG: hypothetical protein RLZZ373_629, partial [Pseudomonadota bacterium]
MQEIELKFQIPPASRASLSESLRDA